MKRSAIAWECLTVWLTALGLVWWIVPARNGWLTAAGILVFIGLLLRSKRRHGESWRDWGVRADTLWPALRLLIPYTLGIIGLFALAWGVGGLPFNLEFWKHPKLPRQLVEYPLWALAQEGICLGFFARRLHALWPAAPWGASLLSASIFASLHLPNFPLTLACFVVGIGWARIFLVRPNLWASALSHAVLGIFLVRVLMMETRTDPAAPNWQWLSLEGYVARAAQLHSSPTPQ